MKTVTHPRHVLIAPQEGEKGVDRGLTVRAMGPADAEALSRTLLAGPSDYMRYFHPFAFDAASLRRRLEAARKDIFFGLEFRSVGSRELVGFYMLRGLDEGYPDPMYGVFVAYPWRGLGIGRLTLAHADTFCRLNRYERILLKVHPDNVRAKALYEANGFAYLRDDVNGQVVLVKPLVRPTRIALASVQAMTNSC